MSEYITSLSEAGSANYHHYLTPTQYAARYGAPASSVDALRAYFKSYGLRVISLSAGHDILRVTGTTTDIAQAFDAPLETVRLSDGALDAHFTSSASLPHALASDVTAVAGLDTVTPLSTNLEVSRDVPAVATAGTCPAAGSSTGTTPNSVGGYTVQQQAALYGLTAAWSAGNTGVGQTIGVYELADYDTSDAQTYFTCYGLAPTISSVNVDGGPTSQDNADNAPDEATLDVEETAALAPGAKVEVYQGTNNNSGPTDIYTQMASDDSATIITTSWGICEAQTDGAAQAEQTIFQEMAAQGQTVVAAAGDDGSSDCEDTSSPSSSAAVDDPASQPYVTGVGGLTVSNINPLSETIWNDNCTQSDCGAGGGGVSSLWSRPSWQVAPGINIATETMRLVPDLAVMGDPATGLFSTTRGWFGFCHHSCSGGWGAIGGTSIGAPLVSALIAVAAQACDTPGGRLGFVNPSLYSMATTGYVDVTSGNNDLYNIGEYSAGVGYDMTSGLGSPNGAPFLAGLCSPGVSTSESSFSQSSTVGVAKTAGPIVTATLRSANGTVIPNAQVEVTASAAAGCSASTTSTTSRRGRESDEHAHQQHLGRRVLQRWFLDRPECRRHPHVCGNDDLLNHAELSSGRRTHPSERAEHRDSRATRRRIHFGSSRALIHWGEQDHRVPILHRRRTGVERAEKRFPLHCRRDVGEGSCVQCHRAGAQRLWCFSIVIRPSSRYTFLRIKQTLRTRSTRSSP